MEKFWVSFCFLFPALVFLNHAPVSVAQLFPSETRILFQVQKLLEYPEALRGWTNWTSFCYLPPSPAVKVGCLNNRVTELSIVGNRSSPSSSSKPASGKFSVSQQTLSESFSIDSLFTDITKLSHLQVLSLVSLGVWGPLPAKINRLQSLEVFNMSSNFIYGEIPSSIASLKGLRSLILTDNLFNGSVPDLKTLGVLQEMNLGGNHLGPKFPSLSTSLVSVVLSNNSFRSEIPSNFKNFAKLQQFDVSSNKLLGPIPPFLFSLPSIQYLSLAGNQLNGPLAGNIWCHDELKHIDISHNFLTGKLPSCLASNSSNRTVLYSWNCLSGGNSNYQHPFAFCHKEALAVKPPIKSKEKEASGMKPVLLLGIVGCVAIVGVLVLLVLVIIKRTRGRRGEENNFDRPFADKVSVHGSLRSNTDASKAVFPARRIPEKMRSGALGLPSYRVFTLDEIEEATDNFNPSNLTAEGSQGQLYKGWLRDGSVVLVKCLKLKQKVSPQSLMQHTEVLSKLRHRNLVSVLGHCVVTLQDHPNTAVTFFVVLENIPNGSLRDCLSDWRKKEMLKWPQRMAITIGVARGVQFLHSGVAPGIVGNKLKIENVLLDDSLTAKISDYNIPMPTKGDLGSPLRGQDNRVSSEIAKKEDIYEVGVILLEVLTGRLAASASEVNELKLQLETGLAESPSLLRAAIDPSMQGTFAYQSLKTTVEITLSCLCKDSSRRPSIEDVLWNLQYSIQVQEGWTSSGNLQM